AARPRRAGAARRWASPTGTRGTGARATRQEVGNLLADRHAGDAQQWTAAVIALHQHADGVLRGLDPGPPGGGADSPLELIADHTGPAADTALGDGPRARRVESLKDVLGLYVETVDVVETAVPRLRYDGQRPVELLAAPHLPGDHGVPHHADAVRVGDHHGTAEEPRFLDPG